MVADLRKDYKLLSHVIVFFLIILVPPYTVLLIHNDTISLPIDSSAQGLWRF